MAFGLAAARRERYHCGWMVAKLGPSIAGAAAAPGFGRTDPVLHVAADRDGAVRRSLSRDFVSS
jgi:hypothetical protein